MNVGDIYISLKADDATFKRDVEKAAGDAADKSGKTFGDKFKASISKAAVGIAAGFGAALGVAVIGRFAELEKATASFRAETGATAEEAQKAGEAINRMAGSNIQPISEIGDTMTALRKNMGLLGDELEAETDRTLKFAQATGQDGVAAVAAMDDLVDRYGFTLDELHQVQDTLITSTQKWGGSVADQQQALIDLQPVLSATGEDWRVGAEALALAEANGIDTAAMVSGLTRAVKQLKPGEGLQDLLNRLNDIKDPADRAREAVRLFGRGAGPQLAALVGKGKVSLDDFALSAEDVTGATTEAAEASLTMFDKVKMAASGFVSGVVDLLGQNGPLLQAVAGLSSLLGPALTTMWAKAAIPLIAAVKASGALAGVGFSTAFVAAAGAGLLAGLALVFNEISNEATASFRQTIEKNDPVWRASLDRFTLAAVDTFARANAIPIDSLFEALRQEMLQHAQGFSVKEAWAIVQHRFEDEAAAQSRPLAQKLAEGILGAAARQEMLRQALSTAEIFKRDALAAFDAAASEVADANTLVHALTERVAVAVDSAKLFMADALGKAAVESAAAYTTKWHDAWIKAGPLMAAVIIGAGKSSIEQAFDEVNARAENFGTGLADAIRGGIPSIKKSMADMHYIIAHPGRWQNTINFTDRQIKKLDGRIVQAIADGKPRLAAVLTAQRNQLVGSWEQLTGRARPAGKGITTALGTGMKDKLAFAREVGRAIAQAIKEALLAPDFGPAGANTAQEYINGIKSKYKAAEEAGKGLTKAVGDVVVATSPPKHPKNPMRNIRKWGQATAQEYLYGFGDVLTGNWLAGLGLTSPVTAAVSASLAPIKVGPSVVEHRHTLSVEAARALRANGFDDQGVAAILLSADRSGRMTYPGR